MFAPDDYALREQAKADHATAVYLARHGLKPFANSHRNILSVLRQSGAPRADCDRVATQITRNDHRSGSLIQGAFDHGQVLGRDGKPLRLVGNPYNLSLDNMADIAALHSLGLTILIHKESIYAFGTYQIEAFAVSTPFWD